ncbi:MAG: hypothetical protein B9S33_14630 [Pedosphaera sp. Tous-C6FEB]|nr:MAG: hypothetical protein B9S33_14630 [Pedosphaera sp. Tous-C6FEB]
MSLINDALKRASDAQAQAAQRPRAPKGVEDLPTPMVPTATRENPVWLPILGLGLVVTLLLGASGFFFAKWWKERKAWQPYATENVDEDGQPITNAVASVEPPVVRPPVATNAAPQLVTTATNSPPVVPVVPQPLPPPPEPPKTNAPLVAAVAPNVPPQIGHLEPPAPRVTNPPVPVPVPPAPVVALEANPPPVTPPTPPEPSKIGEPAPATAAVGFPELMLQGISVGKKKTFAIVNGKTLLLGDRIEGALLVKIGADSVTFDKAGTKRELFLLR